MVVQTQIQASKMFQNECTDSSEITDRSGGVEITITGSIQAIGSFKEGEECLVSSEGTGIRLRMEQGHVHGQDFHFVEICELIPNI